MMYHQGSWPKSEAPTLSPDYIIRQYKAGVTLEEIGDRLGLRPTAYRRILDRWQMRGCDLARAGVRKGPKASQLERQIVLVMVRDLGGRLSDAAAEAGLTRTMA